MTKETAKFVTYEVFDELSKQSWIETIEIDYHADPEIEVQKLINCWNTEEVNRRIINPEYRPSMRKILKINNVEFSESQKQQYCEWEKQNMVTIKDKTGLYDIIQCIRCGIQIKHYQLNRPHQPCFPEKTCFPCHKKYATKEKLVQHQKRVHSTLHPRLESPELE